DPNLDLHPDTVLGEFSHAPKRAPRRTVARQFDSSFSKSGGLSLASCACARVRACTAGATASGWAGGADDLWGDVLGQRFEDDYSGLDAEEFVNRVRFCLAVIPPPRDPPEGC